MSDSWQQLQGLFHAALSLGGEERAAYLARQCVDDDLRREVESLVAASEERESFFERPVLSLGMRVLSSEPVEDLAGRTLGTFKILSLLGRGGMGDVYLAEDSDLGRKVALKFLSGKLAHNPWAKRQFAKEARAVAMLDHQNICAVHRLVEADGYEFIVMQYVEGERLDRLIEERRPDLREALALAVRAAGALAAAHAHGVIHRDIKPSNIIVTPDGQPKVLDFGLAKLVQRPGGRPATEAAPSTSLQPGFIPGTIAYMSPEQLRGQKLDYLTDIFSFGVVLYELIAGRNPFARASEAETISAILVSEPAPFSADAQIPRELGRVVQKCLAKERGRRYQSFNELLVDLEAVQGASPVWPRLYFAVRAAAALALLLLVVAVATFAYNQMNRTRTVAVLPIANETGDERLDYLSVGMTENIIKRLTGLSKLRVKPYGAVSGYKARQVDPRTVGSALGVDAVIVARLTKTGDELNLQAVTVNAEDGSQLWGDVYKIGLAEIFRVEEDITSRVISRLELWPRSDEVRSVRAAHTRNPAAYDQFMLGRYYWRLRDKENIKRAVHHFREAIRLDPLYAQAHAGLSDCFILLNTVHYGEMDTAEAMSKAEAAAKEAVALDDTLPETHTSLGVVNFKLKWDWPAAEREFRRAIEINPEYASAHYQLSNLLTVTGRLAEARAESEAAKNLDPFSSASNMNYCRAFYFSRDYARAAACFERLVREDPGYKNHRYLLGLVHLAVGRLTDATAEFEKLYEEDRALAGAMLGYSYGVAGRRGDALKVLSEVEALRSRGRYIPPQEFAIIHMGLGDRERALALLEEAAAQRFAPVLYVSVDPLFDGLRGDARFADLLRRLNLPPQPPR